MAQKRRKREPEKRRQKRKARGKGLIKGLKTKQNKKKAWRAKREKTA